MGNDSFDDIVKSVEASVGSVKENTPSPQIPIIQDGLSTLQHGQNLSTYTKTDGTSLETSTKNE